MGFRRLAGYRRYKSNTCEYYQIGENWVVRGKNMTTIIEGDDTMFLDSVFYSSYSCHKFNCIRRLL